MIRRDTVECHSISQRSVRCRRSSRRIISCSVADPDAVRAARRRDQGRRHNGRHLDRHRHPAGPPALTRWLGVSSTSRDRFDSRSSGVRCGGEAEGTKAALFTVNVLLVVPSGTVRVAGTDAIAGLLLVSARTAPLGGVARVTPEPLPDRATASGPAFAPSGRARRPLRAARCRMADVAVRTQCRRRRPWSRFRWGSGRPAASPRRAPCTRGSRHRHPVQRPARSPRRSSPAPRSHR